MEKEKVSEMNAKEQKKVSFYAIYFVFYSGNNIDESLSFIPFYTYRK